MRILPCLVVSLFTVSTFTSCDKGTPGAEGGKTGGGSTGGADASVVSATIDGQPWSTDDILVRHAEGDDKLSIHTTDKAGKKDLLLDLMPFTKTQVGAYNSDKMKRCGISLLDADKADDVEFDFDNYLERESPNCIQITSIKDLGGKKQLIEGTFQSEMVPSFNAAGKKTIQIKDGKFRVIYDAVTGSRP